MANKIVTKGGKKGGEAEDGDDGAGSDIEDKARAAAEDGGNGDGADGEEGADAGDDKEEGGGEDLEAERARLAEERRDLELERARLAEERRGGSRNDATRITSAQLRRMNADERAVVERTTGLAFDTVLANVEEQEIRAATEERVADKARGAVRDAIEELVEGDAQMAKHKAAIREYLEDFPAAAKADPERLKALMKKAIVYAKGKSPAAAARRDPGAASRRSGEDLGDGEGDEVRDDPKKGKISEGTYRHGDFKIVIKDLIPPAQRKKMREPEQGTGVRIPADFDEAPRMR